MIDSYHWFASLTRMNSNFLRNISSRIACKECIVALFTWKALPDFCWCNQRMHTILINQSVFSHLIINRTYSCLFFMILGGFRIRNLEQNDNDILVSYLNVLVINNFILSVAGKWKSCQVAEVIHFHFGI